MTGHFKVTDSSQLEPESRKKVWVNLKPDIDLGHLIAMATFIGGLMLQWNAMDRRVTVIEQKQQQLESLSSEVRADLKEIKKTTGTIETNLAVQAAITNGGRKQ